MDSANHVTGMTNASDVVAPDSPCIVRPPRSSDHAGMADLATQLGYECSAAQVRERLTEMRDSAQYAVFVAELPDEKIGGWIGVSVFRSVETGSYAEINGLIVDHSVRSRGIGKKLLNAAEDWARARRLDAIWVHSNVIRERAHQFYLKNGYQHMKTQKVLRKSL